MCDDAAAMQSECSAVCVDIKSGRTFRFVGTTESDQQNVTSGGDDDGGRFSVEEHKAPSGIRNVCGGVVCVTSLKVFRE